MAYYLRQQVQLPIVDVSYVRLIDCQPGEEIEIIDRKFVLLSIERTGNNVEPVYNLETSDLRGSMRIVNGNALLTTVDKRSFEIKNYSIDVQSLGWVKRGGFYSHRKRVVKSEGWIKGEPLRIGQIVELWRNSGSKVEVMNVSDMEEDDTNEFILLKIITAPGTKNNVHFHTVKMDHQDLTLQKVSGDIVYVNNYLESIIPRG